MKLENLVLKYIKNVEKIFVNVELIDEISIFKVKTKNIIDLAKAYLDDAKYYKDKQRLEVSLVSISYCEGLLDALRILGAVKFEWPIEKKRGKEK